MEAERRQELVAQGKELKEKLADLEAEVDTLESSLQIEGQKLPNFTHPDVSLCSVLANWKDGSIHWMQNRSFTTGEKLL